ncbi:MAG: Ig-like domain-containing protein [Flavobacteriaceae bacterium]
MKTTLFNFLVVFISIIAFSHCAKKGSPSGGAKDSIPPIILKSNPENFTTQFKGNEIRVYFDENIKLKELQQNLIISPPLKYQPLITPLTSSKMLKIKILDTLKENTTYVFNFGKSITDNNEGNAFEYYKYVFSTGDYIDSLTVTGTLHDALLPAPDKKTAVMLYEISETFNDSIIFSEKPTYITATKEKDPSFELTNLKEGTYLLLALQEEISNYTFQPKKDKIAFLEKYITLPTDSTYHVTLFNENPDYKMVRPSHVSKNKITFGYEGDIDSLTIEPLSKLQEGFTSQIIKDPVKDSLHYWFKPALPIEEIDTLTFLAKNRNQSDTLAVRLRDLFADSLQLRKLGGNAILPRDSVKIGSTTPLISLNAKKISVLDSDSLAIGFTTFLDKKKNEASLIFPKVDEQTYTINILPEAFEDFFSTTNDSLKFSVKTAPLSDFGTLKFSLQNIKPFPVIIELVDDKFKIVASKYLQDNQEIYFDYLTPNNYYLRIIYDANGNKKWDTGNFLKKIQPENIVYYPKTIEIRSNWDVNEVFIIE